MPAGSIAVRRAFCSGLRAMRVAMGFDSAAGAGAVGAVLLPATVSGVVPVGTVDDAVEADVDAAAWRDEPPLAALAFAPPDFTPLDFAPADFAPLDTLFAPVVLGEGVLFGLLAPPFAACTVAFGLLGPAAAWGTVTVAKVTATARAIGSKRVMGSSPHGALKTGAA